MEKVCLPWSLLNINCCCGEEAELNSLVLIYWFYCEAFCLSLCFRDCLAVCSSVTMFVCNVGLDLGTKKTLG